MKIFPQYEKEAYRSIQGNSQELICNDVNKVIMRIEKKQCTRKFIR